VRPWTGRFRLTIRSFADLDSAMGQVRDRPGPPLAAGACSPLGVGAGHRARMARLPQTALVGILFAIALAGAVRVTAMGRVIDYGYRATIASISGAPSRSGEVLEAAGRATSGSRSPRRELSAGSQGARQEWLRRVDAAGWGPTSSCSSRSIRWHRVAWGQSAASVVDPEHRVWGTRGLYGPMRVLYPVRPESTRCLP